MTPLEGQVALAALRPTVDERRDLARARGKEAQSLLPSLFPGTEAGPAVFVGSGGHAKDIKLLTTLGITCVINLAPNVIKSPARSYAKAGINHLALEARDDNDFNILASCLPLVQSFLDEHPPTGKVLIHCMAGVNRSATVAVAYLMLRDRRNLLELFAECSATRPSILQNANFQLQLCALAASENLL